MRRKSHGLLILMLLPAAARCGGFCSEAFGGYMTAADSAVCGRISASGEQQFSQPVSRFSKDSLMVNQRAQEDCFGYSFSMTPSAAVRSHWLKKKWVQSGLTALITGVAGYMVRQEADHAYSRYLTADTPEKMNHYFEKTVFYDKLSSGLFVFCEMNVTLSMWFSIREVRSE